MQEDREDRPLEPQAGAGAGTGSAEAGTGSAEADTSSAEADTSGAEKKRPRNIVTDFYDSVNISVQQLNIALVVLCAFILLVIIAAAKLGL